MPSETTPECGGDSVAAHQGCEVSGHLYRQREGRIGYECTVCPHTSVTADHSAGIITVPVSAAPRREPMPETTRREEWVVQMELPEGWAPIGNYGDDRKRAADVKRIYESKGHTVRILHRAITERVVSEPTSTVIEGASE